MMHQQIYILGAGNVAKDVLNIYVDLGKLKNVKGFIEEKKYRKNAYIKGIKIFDDSIIDNLEKNSILIGAIGLPIKKRFIEWVKSKGFAFDTVVHPLSVIGDNVNIGEGSIIYSSSILTRDIEMGDHAIININCSISHDCDIGDFVTISPGVNIAGNVIIGEGSWIGIGATIIDNVKIGKSVFIGAGAVVTSDIPDNVLAIGIPAKPVRKLSGFDWDKINK